MVYRLLFVEVVLQILAAKIFLEHPSLSQSLKGPSQGGKWLLYIKRKGQPMWGLKLIEDKVSWVHACSKKGSAGKTNLMITPQPR